MEDRTSFFLRHYPSTPHLHGGAGFEGDLRGRSGSNMHSSFTPYGGGLSGASSTMKLMANSYMPKSNFSTFMQQKKPNSQQQPKNSSLNNPTGNPSDGAPSNGNSNRNYQDDPNPYKVSRIGEYRVKVNNPFRPNRSAAHNRNSHLFSSYYSQDENEGEFVGGEGGENGLGDERLTDSSAALAADRLGLEGFGRLDIGSRARVGFYDFEDLQHHQGPANNGAGIYRSQTMKSDGRVRVVVGPGAGAGSAATAPHLIQESGSANASGAASTSSRSTTGEIDVDGEFLLPDPELDGIHNRLHHQVSGQSGEGCEVVRGGGSDGSGSGMMNPGPVSDSSCTSSEGYSSVSAGICPPSPYAVPVTGRNSSSPDEGLLMEGNDSGTEAPTRISNKDKTKIEYALMGRKTSIFVADCLANLYCMRKPNLVSRPSSSLSNQYHHHNSNNGSYSGQSSASSSTFNSAEGEWVLMYTGVPVLLLDLGETKSRDKRRIQIVLAELGSGLALWKDVIDNLSSYKLMEASHTFHTMHMSSDHTKVVGLSFDDEESADLFYQKVETLTSDFANISLSGAKSKKAKKDSGASKASKIKAKFVKPKKSEISQPCCFSHISSLSSNDRKRFPSLQNFIGIGLGGEGNSGGDGSGGSTNGIMKNGGGGGGGDHGSMASASSHEDFVSMSPMTLVGTKGHMADLQL